MAVLEASAGTEGCFALKGGLQISEWLMRKDRSDSVHASWIECVL